MRKIQPNLLLEIDTEKVNDLALNEFGLCVGFAQTLNETKKKFNISVSIENRNDKRKRKKKPLSTVVLYPVSPKT